MSRKNEHGDWGCLSRELRDRYHWNTLISRHQLTVIPSLCCWMDIHAFTGELARADWNLATAQEQGLIELLGYVYGKAAETSFSLEAQERILILNDGVARTMDLNPPISPTVFAQYVHDLLWQHRIMTRSFTATDQAIRTCLAGGERMQYAPEDVAGICNPAQFQMNTAFARAYIAEQNRTIKDNCVYIEGNWISFVNKEIVKCISVGDNIGSGRIVFSKNRDHILTLLYDQELLLKDSRHNSDLRVFRISHVESCPGCCESMSPFPLSSK